MTKVHSEIQIICDTCGEDTWFNDYEEAETREDLISDGWRFETAKDYCPDCAELEQ